MPSLTASQALQACADRVAAAALEPSEWLVVDLCAGKALAASVLGLLYPALQVIAIDQLTPGLVADDRHHQHQNVRYLQLDVLSEDFVGCLSSHVAAAG